MFVSLLVCLVCLALIYFLHQFTYKPFKYWGDRNIPHKTPLPIVGNIINLVLRRENLLEHIQNAYNLFPDRRYFGYFQFTVPTLMIRDPELIKLITVKDFDHFTDHVDAGSVDNSALFEKNLFQLKGHEWKSMRDFLSPSFTSSKMKAMFVLMSECAKQLPKHFDSHTDRIIEMELKDLFRRYTNDVIATCAFGIQCDSLKNPTNEFFMMGKDVMNFTGLRGILVMLLHFCPSILKYLRIKVFPERVSQFFIATIKESIRYRLENNIVRPDMVHLLLEARKTIDATNGVKDLDDIDITAQAFVFFLAGFEAGSVMLCFLATELAINVDVQERLQREVDEAMTQCNNELDYDTIMQMKYLDMVVSESMRKWPGGPMIDRVCTKPYKIESQRDDEGDGYQINIGDRITIPTYGLHTDEQYFANPNKFDPERFSDDNKHDIQNYTYMPFGSGPRACIGSRFALLEMKTLLVHILAKYEFVVIDKTSVPLKIGRKNFQLQPDNGFWLGIKRRK